MIGMIRKLKNGKKTTVTLKTQEVKIVSSFSLAVFHVNVSHVNVSRGANASQDSVSHANVTRDSASHGSVSHANAIRVNVTRAGNGNQYLYVEKKFRFRPKLLLLGVRFCSKQNVH